MGGRLWWPLVLLLAGGQAQDIEVLSHICKFGLYANGDRYREYSVIVRTSKCRIFSFSTWNILSIYTETVQRLD
jgi:hypothetical protein